MKRQWALANGARTQTRRTHLVSGHPARSSRHAKGNQPASQPTPNQHHRLRSLCKSLRNVTWLLDGRIIQLRARARRQRTEPVRPFVRRAHDNGSYCSPMMTGARVYGTPHRHSDRHVTECWPPNTQCCFFFTPNENMNMMANIEKPPPQTLSLVCIGIHQLNVHDKCVLGRGPG